MEVVEAGLGDGYPEAVVDAVDQALDHLALALEAAAGRQVELEH
jgi:hypothetical protein